MEPSATLNDVQREDNTKQPQSSLSNDRLESKLNEIAQAIIQDLATNISDTKTPISSTINPDKTEKNNTTDCMTAINPVPTTNNNTLISKNNDKDNQNEDKPNNVQQSHKDENKELHQCIKYIKYIKHIK